jgi:hypothetical protein
VPIRPGFFSTSRARNYNNKNISIIFDIITKSVLDNSGGGIISYYKYYVNISRRLDLEHSQVESMWFELKTKLSPKNTMSKSSIISDI